jgi:cytochrome P450
MPTPIDSPRDPIAAATHRDPYPYYAELVARRPIHRDDALGLWVAAGASAVTAVMTSQHCGVRPAAEPVPAALVGSAAGELFGQLVRMTDGPRHAALKPAVSAGLAAFEGRVGEEAARWAEHLSKELRPDVEPARLADFAFRLPVYVLATLLGATADVLSRTATWVDELVRGLAPGASPEAVHAAGVAADGLLDSLAPKRDAPAANRVGYLSQAYEATAGLIGNTLVTLARHPGADRTRLSPIVREVVRYDAPVQNTRRFVVSDATVAGQPLKGGDTVLVVLAAANRDPAANPGPQRFDPRRRERRAFTFGLGAHACPGEALACIIAEAGVRRLLDAGLEPSALLDTLSYRPSVNTRVPLFGR